MRGRLLNLALLRVEALAKIDIQRHFDRICDLVHSIQTDVLIATQPSRHVSLRYTKSLSHVLITQTLLFHFFTHTQSKFQTASTLKKVNPIFDGFANSSISSLHIHPFST